MDDRPIFALNLFNIASRDEYKEYAKKGVAFVEKHCGKVIAFGKYRETMKGNIEPRTVMLLVEWKSRKHFQDYIDDPLMNDIHPHRINGSKDYIWQLFDKMDDLRPILKNQ